MAWNYSDDPNSSKRDEVRFLIGDTDTSDQLLTDREIDFAVTRHSDANLAAVACALAIAAKYSRLADKAVGDLRLSYSQRSTQYIKLAGELKRQAAATGIAPWMPARSIADKEVALDDNDRVEPAFRVGMNDTNPPLNELRED
jgi:hypothetical protein